MTKIVLDDTNSGFNLSKINSNFDKIEEVLNDKVLFRDNDTGEANEIHQTLDMNGNHIINLPKPIALSEPLRLQDLSDFVGGGFEVPVTASQITVNPIGGISSTDVQAALQELSGDVITETNNRISSDTTILAELHTQAKVVNSISALKAVDKTIYNTVYVTSYYAGLVGGSGFYLFDSADITSVDNGGTVIVAADGGRWKLYWDGIINVKNFGAKGDGSTDDTVAMQKAHNTGRLVYYPAGTYSFTTMTFASGGIIGEGTGQTRLFSTDASTSDLITFTGTGSDVQIPMFRDFLLEAVSNSKPSGIGINFLPSSAELMYILMDNVIVYNVPNSVYYAAASNYVISKCKFINYTIAGLQIQNTNEVDSGDSMVSDCLFNTGKATGSRFGLWYRSSGGLKVVNCKFNGGATGFVLGLINTMHSTGDLAISNCSIENQTNFGIFLGRDSGTFNFGAITITNLQIAICPNGIVTDNSGAISQLTISNHNIATSASVGSCIQLNNVSIFTIGPGNLIGQGGSSNGIAINSTCSNGKVFQQNYVGLGSNITNGSGSVTVQPAF